MKADIIFSMERLLQLMPQNRIVECVAVKKNRIIAVGTKADLRPYVTKDTNVLI